MRTGNRSCWWRMMEWKARNRGFADFFLSFSQSQSLAYLSFFLYVNASLDSSKVCFYHSIITFIITIVVIMNGVEGAGG